MPTRLSQGVQADTIAATHDLACENTVMADRDSGFGKAATKSKIQELSEVIKGDDPPSVAVNPGGGAGDDSLLDLVH